MSRPPKKMSPEDFGEKNLTPMMKQYMQAKAESPADSILLFRAGDFYEMFFEDALKAAPILDLVLTHRAGNPMCGVPYRAVDAYIPKLLDAGLKVAVAEQMEDPALAKGLVQRAITRIITPGTILDATFLKPGDNNFLCAVVAEDKDVYGLAWLDISTAEFQTERLDTREAFESELQRLQPRECLLPRTLHEEWERDGGRPMLIRPILWTPLDDWIFSYEQTSELLKRQFSVAVLDGFGLKDCACGVRAAGAVLHYASDTLRRNTGHIVSIRRNYAEKYLGLDPVCQRNLELVEALHGGGREGTLLQILDRTSTAMGSRLMKSWLLKPLREVDAIVERQDVVGLMKDEPLTRNEIRETLLSIRDMERLTAKLNAGAVNPRDLLALANSLSVLPGLRTILNAYDLPLVERIRDSLGDFPELTSRIFTAIADDPPADMADGGFIREGFNHDLDMFRAAITDGKTWIAQLQAKEQERTGIKTLKVHFNGVFGYYIEISKSNLARVPDDYVRKQTLVNCERFITPELKEMESRILGASDKAVALEKQLFDELRTYARTFTGDIQKAAASVARLDVLTALGECASKYRYCRPHVADDDVLHITAGRHPVLDAKMENERFIPNDTLLDGDENRMMIITGPNMAGKSTYIRQTALLVIMAQMGSFIPADEAHVGLVDRVFTRVGAMDDLARGQSTFMVEMIETANILNHATSRSLVILDEIGRGTSTFDGLSIALSVAEYLLDHPAARARTQFATHYHEMTELALTRRGVKNYNVAVREYGDQIIFLRQIVPGAADKSYGIHVAKLAGLPNDVIVRAREILENLEENAIADAGMPSYTRPILRERHAKFHVKRPKKSGADAAPQDDEPEQPTLF